MVKDTQGTANIPVSCLRTTKPFPRNITTEALCECNQINAKPTRIDVADQDILQEQSSATVGWYSWSIKRHLTEETVKRCDHEKF